MPLCWLWWQLKNTNVFSPHSNIKEVLSWHFSRPISPSWGVFLLCGVSRTVVEMFQVAGTFPYIRITRTRCPVGWQQVRVVLGDEHKVGQSTGRDWVGKARERIGMAVGRVPKCTQRRPKFRAALCWEYQANGCLLGGQWADGRATAA